MSGETWRVVLATGEVREVRVHHDDPRSWTAECPALFGAECGITPWAAVVRLTLRWPDRSREILAPGEMTRAEAVEAARREGAEAMREACLDALDDESRSYRSTERDAKSSLADKGVAWERGYAIDRAADAIHALPLPGEVTP